VKVNGLSRVGRKLLNAKSCRGFISLRFTRWNVNLKRNSERKIDSMSEVRPHPAKFSKPILEKLEDLTSTLPDGARVLDPFAGVGGVHSLTRFDTVGVELEPEWANAHDRTLVGDSRFLSILFGFEIFDAVITSPGYASRMSDRYAGDPKGSKRVTYRVSLGRPLTDGSGAAVQWSSAKEISEYKAIHKAVWESCFQVLKHDGLLLLNVSNHIRKGEEQLVSEWHRLCLEEVGFVIDQIYHVKTQRMKMGANSNLRVLHENIVVAYKP